MNKSSALISEYCENVFLRSEGSKKLIVFLPSVNGKNVYPYYPRRSWGEDLSKNFNVLFVSDPYQPLSQYEEAMGSWFISPNGELTLNFLAEKIKQLIDEMRIDDVIFYGSSMGGYAAIVLSSMLNYSKAIAECPQIYLNKHPGSRYICQNILAKNISIEAIEPLSFLKMSKSKHLRIVCSVFDRHYSQHVIPFVDDLKIDCNYEHLNIGIFAYIDHSYGKGHVALRKEDAFRLISDVINV